MSNLPEWLSEELQRRKDGVKPLPDWVVSQLEARSKEKRTADGSTERGKKGN